AITVKSSTARGRVASISAKSRGRCTSACGQYGGAKSLGSTPTTVCGTPSREIDRPIAVGSPSSTRCANAQLSTTTALSPSPNPRPTAGAPSVEKNAGVTSSAGTCSVEPAVEYATASGSIATVPVMGAPLSSISLSTRADTGAADQVSVLV